MNESPGLIGSNRIGMTSRAATLGRAEPIALGERTAPAAFQGKTAAEMRAEHQAWADEQPIATLCGLCDWRFDGTAVEGREEARRHREAEHPETIGRRTSRRRGKIGRPDVKMTDSEYAEAQRARAQREEAEKLATIARGQQRASLELMDAGEPQQPEVREEELQDALDLDAETAVAAAAVSDPPPDEATGPVEPAPAAEAASSQAGDGASTTTSKGDTMRVGKWDKERAIAALDAEVERTGVVPMSRSWDAGTDDHPNLTAIKRLFGNWGNFVEAAGYERPARGGSSPGSTRKPAERPERPAAPPVESRPTPQLPDADELEAEAASLRERAEALDVLAGAVRKLEQLAA